MFNRILTRFRSIQRTNVCSNLTLKAPTPQNCLSVFDHFVGLGLKESNVKTLSELKHGVQSKLKTAAKIPEQLQQTSWLLTWNAFCRILSLLTQRFICHFLKKVLVFCVWLSSLLLRIILIWLCLSIELFKQSLTKPLSLPACPSLFVPSRLSGTLSLSKQKVYKLL